MKDLIICGTGPHAQEMAEIVEQINRVTPTWNLVGFAIPKAEDGRPVEALNGYPVLNSQTVLQKHPDVRFVPAYASDISDLPPDRMVSLISPAAFVSRTARIGPGCVVYPNCFVGLHAVLGRRVFVLGNSVINHDCRLEDRVTVCSGVNLAGFVHVEAGVYLGQACTVRPNLRIGRGSLIGTGSVVVADVTPNTVVAGNPAKKMRDTTPSDPSWQNAARQ